MPTIKGEVLTHLTKNLDVKLSRSVKPALSSGLSRALVPAWLPPALPMATDSREGKSRITVAETS